MYEARSRPWLLHYDSSVPATIRYPDQPIQKFLEDAALRYADRACTIFRGSSISFHDINELSDRIAALLIRMGVNKGERVGLLLPNSPQFVMVFFGILKAGGVVVAINPAYTPTEIAAQVNDSGVQILFVLEDLYLRLCEQQKNTTIKTFVVTGLNDPIPRLGKSDKFPHLKSGDNRHQHLDGDLRFQDLIAQPAQAPGCMSAPDDPAIFQYSGGTTGTSKAAIGTHRNLVANALQTRAWLTNCLDGQETVLMAIPLFHVYGMVFGMVYAMASGSTLLLIPNARDLEDILTNIQRFRPTIFPGVPAVYKTIIQNPDVLSGKFDLRSIKACISGSAPLPREIKDQFEAITGGKLCEGYGLSEAPTATHCNPILGENRPGSIGLPYPDVDAKIVDLDAGQQFLPPESVGELILRGPQVMKGYHAMPAETEGALRMLPDGSGPWLFTGDIARMDKDGYFYLVDRKKELIKPGGLQVWPSEVEAVISAHPGVLEAGVTGIPHFAQGEAIKAWVVKKSGSQVDEEELKTWCSQRLAPFKIPSEIEFLEKLPRTSVGKLLRRELRKRQPPA